MKKLIFGVVLLASVATASAQWGGFEASDPWGLAKTQNLHNALVYANTQGGNPTARRRGMCELDKAIQQIVPWWGIRC